MERSRGDSSLWRSICMYSPLHGDTINPLATLRSIAYRSALDAVTM